jgi:hypothetical protein
VVADGEADDEVIEGHLPISRGKARQGPA